MALEKLRVRYKKAWNVTSRYAKDTFPLEGDSKKGNSLKETGSQSVSGEELGNIKQKFGKLTLLHRQLLLSG